MTGRMSQVSPFQKRNKMLFKLFIGCVIILALLYYIGIILQCLFPSVFKITGNEISFLKAAIPFYYWIAPEKKKSKTKKQNQQQTTTNNNKNQENHE